MTTQSPVLRWSLIAVGAGVLAGLAIALAFAFRGGGGDDPAVVVAPAASTPAAASSPAPASTPAPAAPAPPEPTATPEPTSTPEPTPTATPDADDGGDEAAAGPVTIGNLGQLREAYGEAPDATLGRMRIPVIGVDAPLGSRYVGDAMPNPTGPDDVVWYDFANWKGLGGAPGQGGNAVFSGHVDYHLAISWAPDDAVYQGKGVFFGLDALSAGDVIEVETGGVVRRYAVVWRRTVPAAGAPEEWRNILSGDVAVDSITLLTCGGEFDATTKTYADRVAIRAERVQAGAG